MKNAVATEDGNVRYAIINSPWGELLVAGNAAGLVRISFLQGTHPRPPEPGWVEDGRFLADARRQLRAYFASELETFDLSLARQGTPFQQAVWGVLRQIPYGQTISYGNLASRVGKPSAARAVGAANGANPVPIVVPCHRVIGADGRLTGYGEGLPIKEDLLRLEGAYPGVPADDARQLPLGLE